MKSPLFQPISAVLGLLAGLASSKFIDCDVAIIGGGSSGTYAAIALSDMGKKVVVIESKDQLGGHADTYTHPDGTTINVGVQILHNDEVTQEYLARLDITPTLGAPDTFTGARSIGIDWQNHVVTGVLPEGDPAAFIAGINRYIEVLAEYPQLDNGYILDDPVPEDLLKPLGEFIQEEGNQPILAIAGLLNGVISEGEILERPLLYVLKAMPLTVVAGVLNNDAFLSLPDLRDIYTKAAAELGPKVILNGQIKRVRRRNNRATIQVKTPGATVNVRARKILSSIPPLTSNLRGWDLTPQEQDVFCKFKSLGYMAGIVKDIGLADGDGGSFISTSPADAPAFLPHLPGPFSFSTSKIPGLHKVYYGLNEPGSVEEVQADVLAGLAVLRANPQFAEFIDSASEPEIIAWFDHSPWNLHVDVADIADGFYDKLNGLQGKKLTWWTGAAWHIHDSSLLWAFTSELVSKMFPDG